MSGRVCFAILVLCFNIFADRKLVLDLGLQACPYTNFCHTNAWKTRPNNTIKEPCCFPCSCDDECLEFDNCCPDKELTDVARPLIVPCIDSYVKRRPGDFNLYEGFFRVIDSCPISDDRSNLEPKCKRENKTTLEEFIWVSDKTGKIFQNIHCAKCNGIKEPISWQVQTTCSDILTAKFDNFMVALLSEKCNIINTMPEDLQRITDKYRCIDPQKFIHSSCNETGMMTNYNPAVEIACEQSTWPYIVGLQLAKNVFCVICNRELPEAVADGLCFYAHGKEEKPTHIFLLDYTPLPAGLTDKESNCGSDETFDEFMVRRGRSLWLSGSVGNCGAQLEQLHFMVDVNSWYRR